MPDPGSITLALVTDTHVRVEYDDGQLAFPSDRSANQRNRTMAAAIRDMDPDLVLHLGDVVHPIPILDTHVPAQQVAAEIYGSLGAPLVVVPGNHDVGDKRTTANAPAQNEIGRQAFRAMWGEPFRSLDVGGHHLVVVDGTLLQSPGDEAEAQRAWLTEDLAAATGRIFVFTHYPPYLHEPDEAEHYDNLGLEARGWFLDLLATHGVEALFTGHVHRFFYNRYTPASGGAFDLYTLPAASFVRPEYSALRDAPPVDPEQGRDDREHVGVTKLVIGPAGHELSFVRPLSGSPEPGPRRRLGTWVRRRLGRLQEVPYGDLDLLARKAARDDAVMVHLLDLGLSRIRIPLPDLADPAVRDRVAWLGRAGIATTGFSAGVPTDALRDLHAAHGSGIAWEVVPRPGDLPALGACLATWTGPGLTVGRIGRPWNVGPGGYHSHFPRQGFAADDPALDTLLAEAAEGTVARIAFRIADGTPVAEGVGEAVHRAAALGVGATCHVELPWGTEATPQTDDARVAERVAAAAVAAEAHPAAHVLLDQLYDKDRGYWCRHALLDATDRPRAAVDALKRAPTPAPG